MDWELPSGLWYLPMADAMQQSAVRWSPQIGALLELCF